MKFDLWDCERKRFPPWVLIVWVGSTKIGTSCDVPDWVFGLYFRHFSFLIKSEKFRPRESQGLTNAVLKSGLLIAPPKIPWKITFFWYVERSKRKNTPTPLARGARFGEYPGVYLVVGTKFITPRKTTP